MSTEIDSLESDAARRIIGLYPPKNALAAGDRITRLQGERGLAVALVIADFDPKIAEVRRREGFDSVEFRLQLIGQLGLAAEDCRLHNPALDKHLTAGFDLDA